MMEKCTFTININKPNVGKLYRSSHRMVWVLGFRSHGWYGLETCEYITMLISLNTDFASTLATKRRVGEDSSISHTIHGKWYFPYIHQQKSTKCNLIGSMGLNRNGLFTYNWLMFVGKSVGIYIYISFVPWILWVLGTNRKRLVSLSRGCGALRHHHLWSYQRHGNDGRLHCHR